MHASDFEPFSLAQLEQLRDKYESRNDFASARPVREAIERKGQVQTEELANCGKLFAVEEPRDATGRVITRYVGDFAAAYGSFMSPPITGTINSALTRGDRKGY